MSHYITEICLSLSVVLLKLAIPKPQKMFPTYNTVSKSSTLSIILELVEIIRWQRK